MTLENDIPHVRAHLRGMAEPVLFLVDTGASSGGGTGLLQAETFGELIRQGEMKITDNALAQSLSGMSLRRRGKVGEVALAGYRHADLIFSASARNVLGLNYWSRYVTTFDFPGGAIYLKKGDRIEQPDTQDLSGLTLVRVEGRVVVLSVEGGTPAALAGIKPGDVVLKSNGEEASDIPLVALRRLLAAEGVRVSLLLRRGGDEREVPLVLRPVIK